MADLTFSKSVPGIPQGTSLPATYKRSVSQEVSNVPNLQGAVSQYAANTNWMSALGSEVATRSSAALAAKLGGEAGKNPQGELGPSFTEFDENFKKSYDAQAASTLTIQAQKLITDSNIQLASSPRIDPQMIAKEHQKVSNSLQKIYSLAPSSMRPHLEQQTNSVMLQQQQQLMHRFISEQKQDRKDHLVTLAKVGTENALTLAQGGNSKAATLAVTQINDAVDNALKIKDIDEQTAKSIKDSARQAYLTGDLVRLAEIAEKNKKGPEFYKSLAENKDLKADKYPVINNVLTYMNQQHTLRSMDEDLKTAQMEERIQFHPNEITGADWSNYTASVSPLKAQQTHFKLLQALKKDHEESVTADVLGAHWNDATIFANSEPKAINRKFNEKVQYAVTQSANTANPMTQDQAEVMVAANAGGQIPVFTKTITNKLKNPNPSVVESGIQQIHALLENGNGQALSGLTEQDWSMFSAAQANRDSPDPLKANQDAHNRIYNEDPEVEKMNKTRWANLLTKQNTSGISNDQFGLKTFGFSKSDFINPTIAGAYGTSILKKFSNFFAISGDYEEAKASTKIWVDQNYGNTFINGGKHTTLHPIEKEVGFTSRDGVPYIQADIVSQLNEKLLPTKKLYDEKVNNESWETIPINISKKEGMGNEFLKFKGNTLYETLNLKDINLPTMENLPKFEGSTLLESLKLERRREREMYSAPSEAPSQEHGIFLKTYDPIKLKRTMRTKEGIKTDIFNVILIGNMFGDYDIAIQTKTGMKNLFREAPFLGIMSVSPRKKEIMDHYNKDHQGK